MTSSISCTFIGSATVLLEIDGLRLLTDPVLDPAGSAYTVGKTNLARYQNLGGPALTAKQIGDVDVVLLSHDQHRDNLDREGRALLKRAATTITTPEGARRLSEHVGDRVVGLRPFETHRLESPDGLQVVVTAAPARHGPRGTQWLTGTVTGFILEWKGQRDGALYISGDTRMFAGLDEIARRYRIGTGFVHLGRGRFSVTGPIGYSMDAKEASQALETLQPHRVVPIHYDGWSHFSEAPADLREGLARSAHKIVWLEKGVKTELTL